MLERAIELAPDFGAALAAHAIASVRAWWGDGDASQGREAMDRARRSVVRAQQQAPELAGGTSVEEAEATRDEAQARMSNGRFTTLMRQVAAEVFTYAGAHEIALGELMAAADSALIDLVWLQRCPLLDPLRGDARFRRAEQAVQRRVAAIWR